MVPIIAMLGFTATPFFADPRSRTPWLSHVLTRPLLWDSPKALTVKLVCSASDAAAAAAAAGEISQEAEKLVGSKPTVAAQSPAQSHAHGHAHSSSERHHDLQRIYGLVALVATTWGWAINNVGVKFCLAQGVPPGVQTFIRFTLALLPFAGSLALPSFIKIFPMAVFAFSGNLCLAVALQFTSSGRVGFFSSISTVLVPFIQKALLPPQFQTKIERKHIVGILMSVIGMSLMSWHSLMTGSRYMLRGDLIASFASLCFAVYTVLLGKVSKTFPVDQVTAGLRLWITIFASIWFVLESTRSGVSVPMLFQSVSGASFVLLGILATLVAGSTYTQVYGQRRVSPTEASLLYSLLPVWSATAGYLVFGETLRLEQLLGGALMISGSLYAQRKKPSSKKASEAQQL